MKPDDVLDERFLLLSQSTPPLEEEKNQNPKATAAETLTEVHSCQPVEHISDEL